jgi:glycosyltransferase involved in cell wall biosynthesis
MISNGYPDYPGSYRGIFIKKLCLALKKEGVEIVVLCPKVFKESPKFEIDEGIPVYRFWYPSGGKPLGQSGKIPIFAMVVYMITGLLTAIRLIFKEKPDIIHGNWIVPTGLISGLAGFITGRPVIITAHGMDVRISNKFPVNILFRLAVAFSKKVTVVANYMKDYGCLKNATVIPCGIDERFFEVKPDHHSKTVISTRSLEPVYDIETLIKAVPLVLQEEPDASFIIIGCGSQKEYLQNLANKLGVTKRIIFTGMLDNSEIPSYMEKAKVYVSTSLADGTSVSLLEALAAGLVPVVSDIDANKVFIHENGLFKKGDSKDLSNAIIKALEGSGTPDSGGTFNENVSWPVIAGKYIQLYNQLADKIL